MWVGLRNSRTEGRGPMGLVSHSVLAAHACSVLGDTGESGLVDPTSTMAAVQLCAYVAGTYRGGINDPAEGPSRLAWFLKERMLPPVYWQGMFRGHEYLAQPQMTFRKVGNE